MAAPLETHAAIPSSSRLRQALWPYLTKAVTPRGETLAMEAACFRIISQRLRGIKKRVLVDSSRYAFAGSSNFPATASTAIRVQFSKHSPPKISMAAGVFSMRSLAMAGTAIVKFLSFCSQGRTRLRLWGRSLAVFRKGRTREGVLRWICRAACSNKSERGCVWSLMIRRQVRAIIREVSPSPFEGTAENSMNAADPHAFRCFFNSESGFPRKDAGVMQLHFNRECETVSSS